MSKKFLDHPFIREMLVMDLSSRMWMFVSIFECHFQRRGFVHLA